MRYAEETAEAPSEAEIYAALLKAQERMDRLAAHFKEADRKLSLTREYLDWSKKMEKNSGAGYGAEPDDYMGVDEDVMMDT